MLDSRATLRKLARAARPHLAALLALALACALAPVGYSTGDPQAVTLPVVISGRTLPPDAAAQIRGRRVLLPVAAIAAELGYAFEADSRTETVSVLRAGVRARFVKPTGEVSENGVVLTSVHGLADIMFPPNPRDLLLPAEVVAPLLAVSVSVEREHNLVRVEPRAMTEAVQSTTARGRFDLAQLDYNYGLAASGGSTTQTLQLFSRGRIGDSTFTSYASLVGGAAGPFRLLQSGNFTLLRPNGDRLQLGDFTTGARLLLSTALVRGAGFERGLGEGRRLLAYGGRTIGDLPPLLGDATARRAREFGALDYNTTVFGVQFVFAPSRDNTNLPSRGDTNSPSRDGTNSSSRAGAPALGGFTFAAGASYFRGPRQSGRMVDAGVRYAGARLRFDAEAAAGSFDGTTQERREVKGFGFGFVAGATYELWKFITLQGQFSRFGKNFITVQPGELYTDRQQASFGVSVHPTERLSFGGTYGTTRRLSRPNLRTRTYSLSAAYDPPTRLLPRVFGTYVVSDGTFGKFATATLNLERDYGRVRPFLNYTLASGAGRSDTFNFGAGLTTRRLGQLQFQQSFTRGRTRVDPRALPCFFDNTCPPDALLLTNMSSSGSADWYAPQRFIRRAQFGAGGGYVKAGGQTRLLARAFATVQLPRAQVLQLTFTRTGFDQELRVSLAGPLLWRGRERAASTLTDERLLTDSVVQGRVYLDEDFDHQYNRLADTPAAGVTVVLDSGRVAVTNENGLYRFDQVPPGEHVVALRVEEVRADLVAATGLEQKVTLTPRLVATTEFRLVKSGWLAGRVWVDSDGDGQFEEGETPLADVHVLSSGGRDTYTDNDGLYMLSELPPGELTVYLDRRYVPEGLLPDATRRQATVRPRQGTPDVNFTFRRQPRAVEMKIFSAPPGQND